MSAEEQTQQIFPEQPRKGRSNAILTYEKIDELDHKMTVMVTRFDSFLEAQTGKDTDYQKLKDRVWDLEKAQLTSATASGTSKSQLWTIWVVVAAIITIALQTISTIGTLVLHLHVNP